MTWADYTGENKRWKGGQWEPVALGQVPLKCGSKCLNSGSTGTADEKGDQKQDDKDDKQDLSKRRGSSRDSTKAQCGGH